MPRNTRRKTFLPISGRLHVVVRWRYGGFYPSTHTGTSTSSHVSGDRKQLFVNACWNSRIKYLHTLLNQLGTHDPRHRQTRQEVEDILSYKRTARRLTAEILDWWVDYDLAQKQDNITAKRERVNGRYITRIRRNNVVFFEEKWTQPKPLSAQVGATKEELS